MVSKSRLHEAVIEALREVWGAHPELRARPRQLRPAPLRARSRRDLGPRLAARERPALRARNDRLDRGARRRARRRRQHRARELQDRARGAAARSASGSAPPASCSRPSPADHFVVQKIEDAGAAPAALDRPSCSSASSPASRARSPWPSCATAVEGPGSRRALDLVVDGGAEAPSGGGEPDRAQRLRVGGIERGSDARRCGVSSSRRRRRCRSRCCARPTRRTPRCASA